MQGVSVTRRSGIIVTVNVWDEITKQVYPYEPGRYVEKGYEPDINSLPDEESDDTK